MNEYLSALLFGIIEGLTEFLPISSTAHLRIAEALLGIDLHDGYWKMFTVVIQLGAILCLPIYFRHRLYEFLRTFPSGARGDRTFLTHPLTLVVIAFLATAVPAFLLIKVIGKNLESLVVMGSALLVGGVVMWGVDAVYGSRKSQDDEIDRMTAGQAVTIGLCQALSAIFPGVSRSMATIAGGQLIGLSRAAALEFSFLLSIPTMAAATGYDLLKSVAGSGSAVGSMRMTAHSWALLVIGFVASFIVAYAVVAWFMHWVRKHGFTPFAVYRIAAGIAVLLWATRRT